MTYFQFHLIWLFPAVLAAAVWAVPHLGSFGRRGVGSLLATAAIALLYTTPWDNWLVANEVWGYPPGRVWARIGWVPVEEYLFFLLQPLLTGCFALGLLARSRTAQSSWPIHRTRSGHRPWLRGAGVLLGVAGTLLGAIALRTDRGTYLGLILVWAVPVLTAMWAWRAPLFAHFWKQVGLAIGLPTLYLQVADRWAIAEGIWWISDELSTGWAVLDLPVEEALFFLVTNVLVVFGVFLFVEPALRSPAAAATMGVQPAGTPSRATSNGRDQSH